MTDKQPPLTRKEMATISLELTQEVIHNPRQRNRTRQIARDHAVKMRQILEDED
jgi:hypothetical protein